MINLIKSAVFLMFTFTFMSCGHLNSDKSDVEIESESADSTETVFIGRTDSVNTKSLNEIRFGEWSDEDWYDNDYLRELRHYLNQVYEGQIKDEKLQPYIPLFKSSFTVYKVEPFFTGGLYVQIVFIDSPTQVFEANIYSYVDELTETIDDYEVRGVIPSDIESHFSKEQILELIEAHPEIKLY